MELIDTELFAIFDDENNYIGPAEPLDPAENYHNFGPDEHVYRIFKWLGSASKIDEPNPDVPHNKYFYWDNEPTIDTERQIAVFQHTLLEKEGEDLARANTVTWVEIRERRNELLTESDFIIIKAAEEGTTVPDAWKTYRQALRDIPEDENAPFGSITWPVKPE